MACAPCVSPSSTARRYCPRSGWCAAAVGLSAAGIAAYGRACGFRREQGVPLSYPHVLAFPLHLMLLTRPSFPYPASGMVHLANRIRQHQRLHEGQALRLEVYAERWVAHPQGPGAEHRHTRLQRRHPGVESDSLYLRRDVKDPIGEPWATRCHCRNTACCAPSAGFYPPTWAGASPRFRGISTQSTPR